MQCMKCGKATQEQRVFCEGCMAAMERYPVRLRKKVVIPERNYERRGNRPMRRQRSPEEVIAGQKKTIRRLARLVILLALMLTLAAGSIVWLLYREKNLVPLGSNYNTVETTAATQPK